MYLIIFIILGGLYGMMNIVAGITQLNQKNRTIKKSSSFGMVFSGLLITSSVILIFFSQNISLASLIVGLILMHLLAIRNGIELHGKINIKHHIVRLIISIVIILLFLVSSN